MVKRTPFYTKHLELGAKMVEFAGFSMPIYYEGVIKEIQAVRKGIGLFDVSHMGEVKISGQNRDRFVSYITINDPSNLEEFQAQYSAMCYDDGGIVDDLLVYKLPDYFLLVVNAANTDKDYRWIVQHQLEEVDIEDISNEVAQLALQGPKTEVYLNRLFDVDLSVIRYYHSVVAHFSGIEMLVSRTGYTGEDGFEFYFDPTYATEVWDKLLREIPEIQPCGLGARDVLRLEAKFCLYGNDIDNTTNPIEAGLLWITKLDKDDFIGKEALLIAKDNVKRKLAGFVMEDGIPRKGLEIYNNAERIGFVTSGAYSPTLKRGIGLGYINIPLDKVDGSIFIKIRGELSPAIIIKGAFYKRPHL